MTNDASFKWLHLTDLHRGMAEEGWLWPNIQERFFEDLRGLHEKCGPWDLVLFTGDLTQCGKAEEFQKLDQLLRLLWDCFAELDSKPQLLAVPGNHDLVRPDEKRPSVKLLRQWADDREIQDEFWTDEKSHYRQVISETFQNYAAWWQKQPFRPENIHTGMLPGDFSVTIEKDGAKLGIAGLNTSFLQLGAGDYEKKLALHTRQFHAACEGNGSEWAKQHHACFLLTHHPPAWLDPESQQHLHGEIPTPRRFAVHLCGHRHESASHEFSEAGAKTQRIWQGRSLFGLEFFGEDAKRSHGYA
ncbi:MAG: metallophosphoesterase, partial [Gammaproteobacteria bacterium]|nr:metallophosphoesterase [Gammaproteobacteria bacterium]